MTLLKMLYWKFKLWLYLNLLSLLDYVYTDSEGKYTYCMGLAKLVLKNDVYGIQNSFSFFYNLQRFGVSFTIQSFKIDFFFPIQNKIQPKEFLKAVKSL